MGYCISKAPGGPGKKLQSSSTDSKEWIFACRQQPMDAIEEYDIASLLNTLQNNNKPVQKLWQGKIRTDGDQTLGHLT